MVRAAFPRFICLTDSSKVGTDASVRFAALDEIDVIVTDDDLPVGDRVAFEVAGLEVVTA